MGQKLIMADNDTSLKFFLFAYWHDANWRQFVGASVKIWDLANNLHQMGHQVTLFLPKYGFKALNAPFKIIEIPIIDLPVLRLITFNLFLMVFLLLENFKNSPDVIYLRRTTTVIPAMMAKFAGAIFFFEVNDDPYRDLYVDQKNLISLFRNKLSKGLDELNIKLADRVFVISKEIIQKISLNINRLKMNKFILMPSGANVELFLPIKRKQALDAVRMDPGKKYVGFIGSLLAHQGIETLIHAADKILKSKPLCRFLIIGEGSMKEEWQSMVKSSDLEDAFIFTGQIAYHELPNWVNIMDVCVAPYSDDAGYRSPVKIFDYLACGKPVVTSKIKGTTGVFSDVEAVKLVEPGSPENLAEEILSLLNDPSRSDQIGQRGRKWIKTNYDRRKMAKNVSNAAAELVAEPRRCKQG